MSQAAIEAGKSNPRKLFENMTEKNLPCSCGSESEFQMKWPAIARRVANKAVRRINLTRLVKIKSIANRAFCNFPRVIKYTASKARIELIKPMTKNNAGV